MVHLLVLHQEFSTQYKINKSHLIWIILFGLIGRQVIHWAASLILACKHSPSVNTLSLYYAALVLINKVFNFCLLIDLCWKCVTILVLGLFESICTSLEMMQSLHPQIWRNLGVILRTCGGINDLNVVSIISTFCVMESATISNPSLSYGLPYHFVDTKHKSPFKKLEKLPSGLILGFKRWQHCLIHMVAWHWDEIVSIQ